MDHFFDFFFLPEPLGWGIQLQKLLDDLHELTGSGWVKVEKIPDFPKDGAGHDVEELTLPVSFRIDVIPTEQGVNFEEPGLNLGFVERRHVHENIIPGFRLEHKNK